APLPSVAHLPIVAKKAPGESGIPHRPASSSLPSDTRASVRFPRDPLLSSACIDLFRPRQRTPVFIRPLSSRSVCLCPTFFRPACIRRSFPSCARRPSSPFLEQDAWRDERPPRGIPAPPA